MPRQMLSEPVQNQETGRTCSIVDRANNRCTTLTDEEFTMNDIVGKSLVTLGCLTLLVSAASYAFAGKPNVIVIVADDMGYADAGFTGS